MGVCNLVLPALAGVSRCEALESALSNLLVSQSDARGKAERARSQRMRSHWDYQAAIYGEAIAALRAESGKLIETPCEPLTVDAIAAELSDFAVPSQEDCNELFDARAAGRRRSVLRNGAR